MSREALRRKENSRCAEGWLVCGGKRAMCRGLSCGGRVGCQLGVGGEREGMGGEWGRYVFAYDAYAGD